MRLLPFTCLLICVAMLPGCANDGLAARALDAVGQRKTDPARALKPARSIALRLHAAPKLNTDAQGRPLALVARVYTLRQNAAFEAAPYAVFLMPGLDREAFGADLIEVRDVTLVPGQRYEVVERLPREAAYVGVVALFHSPAPQRWRMSFAADEAESAGLTIAVQACALSAGAGAKPHASGTMAPASARCQ